MYLTIFWKFSKHLLINLFNYTDPFAPIGETGRTILHLAAQLGDSDIVRDLLKRPEAVKYIAAKDNGGETAIEIAKREGHTEVQDLLEAAGRGAA